MHPSVWSLGYALCRGDGHLLVFCHLYHIILLIMELTPNCHKTWSLLLKYEWKSDLYSVMVGFYCWFDKTWITWEKGTLIAELIQSDWPVGMPVLISNCGRRAQSTVSSIITGYVSLGYTRKLLSMSQRARQQAAFPCRFSFRSFLNFCSGLPWLWTVTWKHKLK